MKNSNTNPTIQHDEHQESIHNQISDKPQLLEVVEDINQTTDNIITRIKKGRKKWIGESILFATITLILSLSATHILVYFLRNSYVVSAILEVINEVGISELFIQEVYNPMLIGYSLLYGGDIQATFLFNKMDTYCFSIMPPLFFGTITVAVIWISEEIRYRLTKRQRDMYANIYLSVINAVVVVGTALVLGNQVIMNAEQMGDIFSSPKLAPIYSAYISYVDTPTLKVSLGVDELRLFGMSFIITMFTLTFCAKKHLVFETYKRVKGTYIYIMKMLLISVVILAGVTIIKAISLEGEAVIPSLPEYYYFRGFIVLLGVFFSALTTGHLNFLSYLVDTNSIMHMEMEVFTIDAYVKRELFQLDNPVGSYYLVLVLLVVGMLFVASCKHFKGKTTKFSRGLKESIGISVIVSFSIGMLSRLGCMAFRIMCDTASREMSYSNLEIAIGAIDFWTVSKRVFVITSIMFMIGWSLSQLCPNVIDLIGDIFTSRASIILWVGIVLIVAITIAVIINPDHIRSVYELYNEAMSQSKGSMMLKLRELIR